MTAAGVIVRTLACFALVFATWNPSGYSYLAWLHHSAEATAPEKAVVGAVLVALHILFVRIAWLSLGADGVTAALAVVVAGIFTLYEFDIVDLWQGETWLYLLLASFSLVLALGIVWSLLKRRIVGQSNYLKPPP